MGQPVRPKPDTLFMREEPGEVKHLSTPRRRNRRDSPSSGERNGRSPNQFSVKTAVVAGLGLRVHEREVRRPLGESAYLLVEMYWESMP